MKQQQQQVFIIIWLCLLFPLFFLSKGCAYTSISTRQHQAVFRYTGHHKSEKDLPICAANSVCSVLHKRYWFPSIAERICRCPTSEECPWKWNNYQENNTMLLNNRAQLKFCTSIINLPTCASTSTALTSISTQNNSSLSINLSCFCPLDHHWRHSRTSRTHTKSSDEIFHEEYICDSLKKCKTLESCGNVRLDTNAIYYSCSCPFGHECVYNEKQTKYIEELLYKGQGYKAICEPIVENYEYE